MVLYKFDVCFYAFSIIEMRQEKKLEKLAANVACVRTSERVSERA